MPIEICGMVSHNTGTPLSMAPQDEFNIDAMIAFAVAQEAAGYDRVLIANNALMPDPHTIATYVAAQTTRLKFLIDSGTILQLYQPQIANSKHVG